MYVWLLLSGSLFAEAQSVKTNLVPEGYQRAQVLNGDTVPVVNLREVYVYPPVKFKNKREQNQYKKLVRDVNRTLPYVNLSDETLAEA